MNSKVLAVAHDKKGTGGIPVVNRQTMAGAELPGLGAGSSKFSEKFSILGIFIDQVRSVAVRHIDRSIRCDIGGGGFQPRAIFGALFIFDGENDIAIKVDFADAVASGGVEILLSGFFAHHKTVEAA